MWQEYRDLSRYLKQWTEAASPPDPHQWDGMKPPFPPEWEQNALSHPEYASWLARRAAPREGAARA